MLLHFASLLPYFISTLTAARNDFTACAALMMLISPRDVARHVAIHIYHFGCISYDHARAIISFITLIHSATLLFASS